MKRPRSRRDLCPWASSAKKFCFFSCTKYNKNCHSYVQNGMCSREVHNGKCPEGWHWTDMAKICENIVEHRTICPFGCSPTWRMCHRDDCRAVPENDCCPQGWHITEKNYRKNKKALLKLCKDPPASTGTEEKKTAENVKKMIPLYRFRLGLDMDTPLTTEKIKEAYQMARLRNRDPKEVDEAYNILMDTLDVD